MKKNDRAVGFRTSCLTWESLIIISKFGNTTVSKTINKMLDIFVKQLLDKIPPDKLAEIKKKMEDK
jgi:hypothetical protein